MPRLPTDQDLGARPLPNPTAKVVTYQPFVDSSVEQALYGVGKQMEIGAEKFMAAAEREQARMDALRAEDAFTQLRQQQLNFTLGPDGFSNIKGADAVKRPLMTEYKTRFDDAVAQLEGGLTTSRQKEMFRTRASMAGLQYQEDLIKHVTTQNDAFGKQVFQAGLDTEKQLAVVRYEDEGAINTSLVRIEALVRQEGERLGLAPGLIGAQVITAQQDVHAAVITQALASDNPAYAEAYFNRHAEKIVDPKLRTTLESAVAEGAQKELYNNFNAAFIAVRDNRQALEALQGTVTNDDKLHEERKNALQVRIASRIDLLEQREQQDRLRTEAIIGRGIEHTTEKILKGYAPSDEDMQPIVDAAKGHPLLEQDASRMMALATTMRQFIHAPLSQQEAFIAKLEANLRDNPMAADPKLIESFRSIHENQKQRSREDPVNFATSQGLAETKPLDLTNPGNAAPQLAERFALARSMSTAYQAPLRPLTDEESKLYVDGLNKMPIEARAQWFGDLYKASGGDDAGYLAIMEQLAKKDPVLGTAGALAALPKGQEAAVLAMEGQKLLSPGEGKAALIRMPPEKEMRKRFDSMMGDALRDMPAEEADRHFRTSMAIYAAMAKRSGDDDPANLGMLGTRYKDAVTAATGKVMSHEGHNIVLPYGWDESRFKDALDAQMRVLAASGRLDPTITKSRLMDFPLVTIGNGQYTIRNGDADLKDRQGNRVILDFNRTLGVPSPATPVQPRPQIGPGAPPAYAPAKVNTVPLEPVRSQAAPTPQSPEPGAPRPAAPQPLANAPQPPAPATPGERVQPTPQPQSPAPEPARPGEPVPPEVGEPDAPDAGVVEAGPRVQSVPVPTSVAPTKPEDVPGMVRMGNLPAELARESMPLFDKGLTVLIPTRGFDGKLLTEAEAVRQYRTSGRNLGKFATEDLARAYQSHVKEWEQNPAPQPSAAPVGPAQPGEPARVANAQRQPSQPGNPASPSEPTPPAGKAPTQQKAQPQPAVRPDGTPQPKAVAPPPPQPAQPTAPGGKEPAKPASMISSDIGAQVRVNIELPEPKQASSPERTYFSEPVRPKATKYDKHFTRLEAAYQLPKGVLKALAYTESSMRENAKNVNKDKKTGKVKSDDLGIMQINSIHLKTGEKDWRKDPVKSIEFGAKYYAAAVKMAKRIHGNDGPPTNKDLSVAYQIYNAGPGNYKSPQAVKHAQRFAKQWALVMKGEK